MDYRTYLDRMLRAARTLLRTFSGSREYWQNRYANGDNSGHGSVGELATFKAEVLNDLVIRRDLRSVIEFGCGDGRQLKLFSFPQYVGFDVSTYALDLCREAFSDDNTKRFRNLDEYRDDKADLALSLDVIQHLVEDTVFTEHMRKLFGSARQCVAIYSGNFDDRRRLRGPHVCFREFTRWIEQHETNWKLLHHIPNPYPRSRKAHGSFSEFFIYVPIDSAGGVP